MGKALAEGYFLPFFYNSLPMLAFCLLFRLKYDIITLSIQDAAIQRCIPVDERCICSDSEVKSMHPLLILVLIFDVLIAVSSVLNLINMMRVNLLVGDVARQVF
jgi:hypothetical protein